MASLHPDHLRAIIRTVLQQMDIHSPAAEELLLGTAAHESHLGRYLQQVGGGPARGLYQMEPDTEEDIWRNYLAFRHPLAARLSAITGVDRPSVLHLQFNPVYATAMARLHYRRVKDPLPAADDLDGLASYWDRHYNRNPAKGFPAQFSLDYRRLVFPFDKTKIILQK